MAPIEFKLLTEPRAAQLGLTVEERVSYNNEIELEKAKIEGEPNLRILMVLIRCSDDLSPEGIQAADTLTVDLIRDSFSGISPEAISALAKVAENLRKAEVSYFEDGEQCFEVEPAY